MRNIDFNSDKFAIIGLGDTGISVINYLKSHDANIIGVFDTRNNPPNKNIIEALDIPIFCGALDYMQLHDANVIVLSPGVSIYESVLQRAVHNNKLVIGDIELFAQAISGWSSKVIGVTGSNGKTTVTSLCGFIADKLGFNTLIAGNIGIPVLNSYLDIVKSGNIPDVIVLELSSFQLESCYSLCLDSATVLNISEDHLDRYSDLLEYAYVKSHIFNNAKVQILNANDIIVKSMLRHNIDHLWFGEDINFSSPVEINYKLKYNDKNELMLAFGFDTYVMVDSIKLIGKHNYLNCLASIALLNAVGVNDNNKIVEALCEFYGLEHRMQKIAEHKGIIYIEDSKGTNVGAVCAGVSGLDMPVNLILGGDGKGQDFSPLRGLIINKCRSVVIIGQDKYLILDVLSGLDVPINTCETLEGAIDTCMKNALPGDAIVLSPACASLDMFDNYKHRAKVFVDYVNAQIN